MGLSAPIPFVCLLLGAESSCKTEDRSELEYLPFLMRLVVRYRFV